MATVIVKLRAYLLGWKAYFRLAQTPSVWRKLDAWLRHWLRAIQLKQWKRGTTIYREARKLGAPARVAQQAATGHGTGGVSAGNRSMAFSPSPTSIA